MTPMPEPHHKRVTLSNSTIGLRLVFVPFDLVIDETRRIEQENLAKRHHRRK